MSESTTVSRKSSTSTLTIGSVQTPVALYKILGDPSKSRKWELANEQGEPWQAPVPGTADGSAPEITGRPGAVGSPLGEAPADATDPGGYDESVAAADAAEGVVPDGASEGVVPGSPEPPAAIFEDTQIVYLAGTGDKWEICGEEYVKAPEGSDEYTGWVYDLQKVVAEDGDGNKAGDIQNGVQEGSIYARSPVPRKGVRKEDGTFVDLTDQIEEIGERSTLEEMRVVSFIDSSHVPRERIIGSYYLAGDTAVPGQLPPTRLLATLMKAMRAQRRVAVVRFSKRKGQTLGILVARRDGAMVVLELAFAAQERKPNPTCLAPNQVEVPTGDVAGAVELIEAMAGKRDSLDAIRDPRVTMETELMARAAAGELDDLELGATLVEDEEVSRLGELLASVAV